jgi:hypothetical protein
MAKRTSASQFYELGKKKYGAEKVKSLTWPEIVVIAKENDVLIPSGLPKMKVARGRFTLVPADHVEKEEPKAAAPAPAPKAEPKAAPAPAPVAAPTPVEAPAEYKRPNLHGAAYFSEWSRFYDAMKKEWGEFKLKRVESGKQTRDRLGTMCGDKLMVDENTHNVMGIWTVSGSDKMMGRGFVVYGSGYVAKKSAAKAETPKAEPAREKRKGGTATDAEKKAALLDVKLAMRDRDAQGADWGEFSTNGNAMTLDVRYWGRWENPEGEEDEEDYDWQKLSAESRKKLERILGDIEKRHPKVALSYSTEEKNWLVILAN